MNVRTGRIFLFLACCSLILPLTAGSCFDANGESEALLEVSGENFGKIALKKASVVYLKIRNAGDVRVDDIAIEGLSGAFEIEGGAYPGNTGSCPTDRTLDSYEECLIPIKIAAQATPGSISQKIWVDFLHKGNPDQKEVELSGEIVDLALLQVSNIDFGEVAVGTVNTKQLALKNLSHSETINNLELNLGTGSSFTITNPSSCGKIEPNTTCNLNARFEPRASANPKNYVNILYDIAGDKQKEKIWIKGQAIDDDGVTITHNVASPVAHGARPQITLSVRKLPGPVITQNATNLSLLPLPVGYNINIATTTCNGATVLNDGGPPCIFAIEAPAQINLGGRNRVFGINETFRLGYRIGGRAKTYDHSLNNVVQVTTPAPAPPAAAAPAPALAPAIRVGNFDIKGANFGVKNVPNPGGFDAPIEIENSGPGGFIAKNLSLERKGHQWARAHQITQAPKLPESTCLEHGKILNPGDKCTFVIRFRNLTASFPTDQELTFKYDDAGNQPREENFFIRGSWVVGAAVAPLPVAPIAPGGIIVHNPLGNYGVPIYESKATQMGHPWFAYEDRRVVYNKSAPLSPANLSNFPEWVWNKIPNKVTTFGVNYVPWAFKPEPEGPKMLSALSKIVPERVKDPADVNRNTTYTDPATGKKFVRMFHGSAGSSAALAAFRRGAGGIDFGLAYTIVYGPGFYLTSDPNEARHYACVAGRVTQNSVLLVVGVDEDLIVKGKMSYEDLSLGRNLADLLPGQNRGDPKDLEIYFRRNNRNGGQNQIVTFSNARRYLRILEIVHLGTNFQKSAMFEGDGKDHSAVDLQRCIY